MAEDLGKCKICGEPLKKNKDGKYCVNGCQVYTAKQEGTIIWGQGGCTRKVPPSGHGEH